MKFSYRIIIRFWKEDKKLSFGKEYSFEIYHSEIFQNDFLMDKKSKERMFDISDSIEMDEIANILLENDLSTHITDTPKCFEVYGEADLHFYSHDTYEYGIEHRSEIDIKTAQCQEVAEDDVIRIFGT